MLKTVGVGAAGEGGEDGEDGEGEYGVRGGGVGRPRGEWRRVEGWLVQEAANCVAQTARLSQAQGEGQ